MIKDIELLKEYFREYSLGRGLKEETVKRKLSEVERFMKYLRIKKIGDIRDVKDKDIEEYFESIKDLGFSNTTKMISLNALKDLFYVLDKHEYMLFNPFQKIDIVFREQRGTKVVLTEDEMIKLLDCIPTHTGYGIRDRAMFEMMYIAGLRIGEVLRLEETDINFNQDEIFIRQSKNRKDRIVPLGSVCKKYLSIWIKKHRAWFIGNKESRIVFLNKQGGKLAATSVRYLLKKYLMKAGITKKGVTPHSIRHSCATHLLLHGADIRYVQELLGHESIETTAEYTKGIIEGLRKMYKMHHPRENELFKDEEKGI